MWCGAEEDEMDFEEAFEEAGRHAKARMKVG
jgi:hypothetical protein